MSKLANLRRCEILGGLALLFSAGAISAAPPPDANYVLIMDRQNPGQSRLLIFSGQSIAHTPQKNTLQNDAEDHAAQDEALALTSSAKSRERVRGLTLLSGMDSVAALNAALVLLSDPVIAVREEAFELALDHPAADFDAVAKVGMSDSSPLVRDLVAEHIRDQRRD